MNWPILKWLNPEKLIPNNKNPRQNPSIKTKDIQKILLEKGFEEAIVAYKSGAFYTVISGHRRLHASKELGLKQVPVYVVQEPKDTLEELERLGAIQGNQYDWNEYEWLIHTSNLFNSKPNMNYEELASKLKTHVATVKKRLFLLDFYSKHQLETLLVNYSFSVHMLDTVRLWCLRVKKYHPNLYADLSELYIKESMINKLENKLLNSEILKGDYLKLATEKQLLAFLTTHDYKIKDFIRHIESNNITKTEDDLDTNIKTLKKAITNLDNLKFNNKNEAKLIYEELNLLENEIQKLNNSLLS